MLYRKMILSFLYLVFASITLTSCDLNPSAAAAKTDAASIETGRSQNEDGFSLLMEDSFAGTWKRTNVESAATSTVYIDNITKVGFDFSISSIYWSHTGSFTGKAKFLNSNEAVCTEIEDEENVDFRFVLKNQILTIPEFENQNELPVGMNVTISGDYVRENPQYTNASNYALIVPNEGVESIIRSLMDSDTYDYFDIAAHEGYITETAVGEYFLYHIETRTIGGWTVNIIIADDNIVYIWCGFGQLTFYTNDEEYLNSDIYKLAEQIVFGEEEASSYDGYMTRIQYLDEIERKMSEALTTKEMIETRENALYYWDIELNRIYALFVEKLSVDEMEKLRIGQRQWIKDRDYAADNALSLGGSIASVNYSDILFLFTKQRTIELIQRYFNYYPDKDKAMEAYREVLKNESQFFCTDENKFVYFDESCYFKGIPSDEPFTWLKFAVTDMDGAAAERVILESNDNAYFTILVLNYENGVVYGHGFGLRSMYYIKKDGTYTWTNGAANSGYGKLKFFGENKFEINLASYEDTYDEKGGFLENIFMIGNRFVTEAEYDNYAEQQNKKEDITWYDFTEMFEP